ncbi:UNVERIFIED_CONTAM: hypothetical protein RMT77_017001 [Armadillidium vulgare]
MDVEYQSSGGDEDSKSQSSSPCRPVDDAQEILRDLYETCINEGITDRSSPNSFSPPSEPSYPTQQTTYSFSVSASCSVSSSINNSSSVCNNNINNNSNSSSSNTSNSDSCTSDWSRHSQYPFNCGQSSLLGNDLQSVVFHSLITSLES